LFLALNKLPDLWPGSLFVLPGARRLFVKSPCRSILFEHDLFRKTGIHFSGSCYGPFASFFWPGVMRLDGDGAAPVLLASFPAGCAPSVLPGLGTPAFVPGID
jgi:hypothetical protein